MERILYTASLRTSWTPSFHTDGQPKRDRTDENSEIRYRWADSFPGRCDWEEPLYWWTRHNFGPYIWRNDDGTAQRIINELVWSFNRMSKDCVCPVMRRIPERNPIIGTRKYGERNRHGERKGLRMKVQKLSNKYI